MYLKWEIFPNLNTGHCVRFFEYRYVQRNILCLNFSWKFYRTFSRKNASLFLLKFRKSQRRIYFFRNTGIKNSGIFAIILQLLITMLLQLTKITAALSVVTFQRKFSYIFLNFKLKKKTFMIALSWNYSNLESWFSTLK